jgi:hypothetical protein
VRTFWKTTTWKNKMGGNIKMDVREVDCEVEVMEMVQDRV